MLYLAAAHAATAASVKRQWSRLSVCRRAGAPEQPGLPPALKGRPDPRQPAPKEERRARQSGVESGAVQQRKRQGGGDPRRAGGPLRRGRRGRQPRPQRGRGGRRRGAVARARGARPRRCPARRRRRWRSAARTTVEGGSSVPGSERGERGELESLPHASRRRSSSGAGAGDVMQPGPDGGRSSAAEPVDGEHSLDLAFPPVEASDPAGPGTMIRRGFVVAWGGAPRHARSTRAWMPGSRS